MTEKKTPAKKNVAAAPAPGTGRKRRPGAAKATKPAKAGEALEALPPSNAPTETGTPATAPKKARTKAAAPPKAAPAPAATPKRPRTRTRAKEEPMETKPEALAAGGESPQTGTVEPVVPETPAVAAGEPAELFDPHVRVGRPSDPESGKAPGGETPADAREALRQKVLRELPFLSDYYNETYLYLVPCDPQSLFVVWEVGEATRSDMTLRFGPDFLAKNSLILRVYDVTGVDFDGFNANAVFEVDDFLNDKVSYWVKVSGARSYVAELGYRAHGTTFFEKVARSNSVMTPRGVPEPAEMHVSWGSVSVPPHDVEIPVGDGEWRFNQYLYWKQRRHAAPEEKGYWALVLHQHLPFVRHPEYDVALEEQWFFEAVVSVYTQLLNMMWRLERDKVDFRLTVSLTPPLLSMMQDPLLKVRAARHIDECIRLATREVEGSAGQPWHATALQSLERFRVAKTIWETYEGDLTRGYRDFQNAGKLEVITCPATHFVLPLFKHFPETVRAQVQVACRQYQRVFGRWPRGIWLAENAWTPGLDEVLAAEGIKYFLLNGKGLLEGDTKPFFGTTDAVVTPRGVAAFGIDEETRAKIWSRQDGYPGAPNYKEWYRDLGYDAGWDYLPEYWKTAGVRRNTGLKYYRITGRGADLGAKTYYVPEWAEETLREQAGQFVFERGAQVNHWKKENGGRKPVIVSAYDAELFGHWWEEGPGFIETVFRKMLHEQAEVRPVTLGEFLAENPHHQQMTPGPSSWGKGDYFQTWVEGRAFQPNNWVYRHIYRLCGKMTELATRWKDTDDLLRKRALDQAARSLFLAGASDWGFLISTGQAVRYSEVQIVQHMDRTKELLRQIEAGEINEVYLSILEEADTIFPFQDMDFRVFCKG